MLNIPDNVLIDAEELQGLKQRIKELEAEVERLNKLLGYCSKERDEIWAKLKKAEDILRIAAEKKPPFSQNDFIDLKRKAQEYFSGRQIR